MPKPQPYLDNKIVDPLDSCGDYKLPNSCLLPALLFIPLHNSRLEYHLACFPHPSLHGPLAFCFQQFSTAYIFTLHQLIAEHLTQAVPKQAEGSTPVSVLCLEQIVSLATF